ncbi:laminin subunit alpha-5 isoform X1 [Silurus asotus]|uniref:Laminin subunit alpha-5 isoform X1 n=1 Tax=Silurus asotus TaxID=30991 RepID=A0AAD5B3F6_SILAS|nr:laminin subunit alpha-5 isoform X1 [Silurus asotus]
MAQRRKAPLLFPALICALAAVRARASVSGVPGGLSLTPPYFNLAEGSRISATATCGEEDNGNPRTDLYCKLVGGPTLGLTSQTIQGQYCDHCNANNPEKAHPVNNAIDGTERWWQSPPLSRGLRYNEINVTLDLGQHPLCDLSRARQSLAGVYVLNSDQLFHVAYIIVKFANSPRPDLWVLERSVDHGKTFTAWQYFAHLKKDCIERFGKEPNVKTVWDDEQICTTEYSRLVPLENGEIFVSLVNGRPGSKNFTYSPALQEFTTATHIRLRFLRTNTLLGHLISKAQRDPTVTRRDSEVAWSPLWSLSYLSLSSRSNIPLCWAVCQVKTRSACQCHSHATDCYYDAEVERRRASLNIHGRYDGGGVCTNCQHNTAGVNCEVCAEGYYRPYGVPVESPTGCIPYADHLIKTTTPPPTGNVVDCPVGFFGAPSCQPCLCDGPGVADGSCDSAACYCSREGSLDGSCDPNTACLCDGPGVADGSCDPADLDSSCNPAGSDDDTKDPLTDACFCLPYVEGAECERCKPLYWNLDPENPAGCVECTCDDKGTLSGVGECHEESGECSCKPNVCSPACDTCDDGYFLLQKKNYFGCQGCQCDVGGATGRGCDQLSGQCQCRKHMRGRTCSEPEPNFYIPDVHHLKFEAENGITPNARPVRFGYDPNEFPKFSWRGYATLSRAQPEVMVYVIVTSPGPFTVIMRYMTAGLHTSVRGRVVLVAGSSFSSHCSLKRSSSLGVVWDLTLMWAQLSPAWIKAILMSVKRLTESLTVKQFQKLDGCIPNGVRSSHEWPLRLKSMEQALSHVAHKLPGDAGPVSGSKALSPRPEGLP